MLTLEEVKKGAAIIGIEPGQVVRMVTTVRLFSIAALEFCCYGI